MSDAMNTNLVVEKKTLKQKWNGMSKGKKVAVVAGVTFVVAAAGTILYFMINGDKVKAQRMKAYKDVNKFLVNTNSTNEKYQLALVMENQDKVSTYVCAGPDGSEKTLIEAISLFTDSLRDNGIDKTIEDAGNLRDMNDVLFDDYAKSLEG